MASAHEHLVSGNSACKGHARKDGEWPKIAGLRIFGRSLDAREFGSAQAVGPTNGVQLIDSSNRGELEAWGSQLQAIGDRRETSGKGAVRVEVGPIDLPVHRATGR